MALLRALILALCLLPPAAAAAPAMWEARDADSRVLLFGSFHALPPGLDWRTSLLDDALKNAHLVYFETDVGPLGATALVFKVIAQQFQGPGEPWLDRLTPEQLALLEPALEASGLTLEEAGAMRPWVVAMQLTSEALATEGAAFDMANGVETTLQWELPKERKGYLETPGEQFDLIAGGTIEQQIVQLMMTVEDGAMAEERPLTALAADWVDGRPEELELDARNADEAAMLEIVLTRRNRNWVPQIEAMLRDNHENVVIVGAGHLVGKDNLLDLLEDAGYTVRRIQ